MMGTALETSIFNAVVKEIEELTSIDKEVSLVDICCGTGILASLIARRRRVRFTGVDVNATYIRAARKKLEGSSGFSFILGDALNYAPEGPVDIVTLTSAYHHIIDRDKRKLLMNVHRMLKESGAVVIYEKCIREYANRNEFKTNNEDFYSKRIEFLQRTEKNHLSRKQHEALLNIRRLSASGEEEYKVSYQHLMRDLGETGYEVVKLSKVWPSENLFDDPNVGDFIFVVKRKV